MPSLVVGSILEADADAIVNPANSFLNHGGGLAGIIASAAAPLAAKYPDRPHMWEDADREWRLDQSSAPLIATGDAYPTSAGTLPFEGVIHAVGPVWKDGTLYERQLLSKCVWSIAEQAAAYGWTRIAVPAISCGLFRYPVEDAARVLWVTARHVEPVYLVSFTFYVMPEHQPAFEAASAR